MAKLDHSIVINRPVEDVFEFMSNPENEKLYRTGILELEQTSDGTKVTMEFEGEIGGFFKVAESMVL